MQKSKKQRIERQLRQSLKTYRDLSPHIFSKPSNSLLQRLYPDITNLNSLRMFAVLEILYILQMSISLLEKRVPNHVSDLKIGIIGGGITTRLILNSILPLSKDGLNLRNITISTRQVENFHIYSEQFGIKVVFKNEQTARDADILIIATPATLDNWVVCDLKKSLQQRLQDHESSHPKQPTNTGKLVQQKSAFGKSVSVLSGDNASKFNGSGTQMSGSIASPTSIKRFMKPLVYVLTSDFSEEKCQRLFQIPVLVPSIRAKNVKAIYQHFEGSQIQSQNNQEPIEKAYAWWLIDQKIQERKIDSREGKSDLQSYGESQLEAKLNKYYSTPFFSIFKVLNFCFGNTLSVNSLGSSLSITVSLNESNQGKKHDETMSQIYELATISGQVEDTFLKKCRKWKMAHNNFIA